MTDQASREAFEAWATNKVNPPYNITRCDFRKYKDARTKDAYNVWQAALTHANTEMEKMRKRYEVVRLHAISADCGRMCDNNKSLNYREQWKLSEAHIDGLERIALELPPTPQAEG